MENVIFIYLQTKDWIVIPRSRKADTMRYEFDLKNKKTGKAASVQVKTHDSSLKPSDYKDDKRHIFLFQANGNYEGLGENDVECLEPEIIESFIRENKGYHSVKHCQLARNSG